MLIQDYQMTQILLLLAIILICLLMWFYTHDEIAKDVSFWQYVKACWKSVKSDGVANTPNAFFVVAATHLVILIFVVALLSLGLMFIGGE